MKKKISLLLCTLALALGMTACGELKSSDKLAGRTVSSYREEVTEYMNVFGDTLAGDRTYLKDDISQELQTSYGVTLEDAAASFGMSVDELLDSQFKPEDYLATKFDLDVNDKESAITTLYNDFQECVKDAGDYKVIKYYSVENAGKTITSTVIGDFSKRDLK
ncbi:MAG: hypothetical protein IKZ85_09565, partial [Pseudobutyrivibrio sp.]|nr:hypothetical protein [Pseudobutyrivibrio sp.]